MFKNVSNQTGSLNINVVYNREKSTPNSQLGLGHRNNSPKNLQTKSSAYKNLNLIISSTTSFPYQFLGISYPDVSKKMEPVDRSYRLSCRQ